MYLCVVLMSSWIALDWSQVTTPQVPDLNWQHKIWHSMKMMVVMMMMKVVVVLMMQSMIKMVQGDKEEKTS